MTQASSDDNVPQSDSHRESSDAPMAELADSGENEAQAGLAGEANAGSSEAPKDDLLEPIVGLEDGSNDANDGLKAELSPMEALAITKPSSTPPPIPAQFRNLAAKGGAIASIVLGILALVGSFFSGLSLINALLGIVFGLWGLRSDAQMITKVGLATCLLALGNCIWQGEIF